MGQEVRPPTGDASNEAPEWAKQLSKVVADLAESVAKLTATPGLTGAGKTASFANVAKQAASQPVAKPPQAKPVKPEPKAPAPRIGESGSGYTRISNGRLVRNKRPKARPLQERQAKNWRSRATQDLVSFLKERNLGKDDPKPVNDPVYTKLVAALESAKAYMAYVGSTDQPMSVEDWRRSNLALPVATPVLQAGPVSSANALEPSTSKGKESAVNWQGLPTHEVEGSRRNVAEGSSNRDRERFPFTAQGLPPPTPWDSEGGPNGPSYIFEYSEKSGFWTRFGSDGSILEIPVDPLLRVNSKGGLSNAHPTDVPPGN